MKYKLIKQEGTEIELLGEVAVKMGIKPEIILIKGDDVSHEQLLNFQHAYEQFNPENEKFMILHLPKGIEVEKLILEEIPE